MLACYCLACVHLVASLSPLLCVCVSTAPVDVSTRRLFSSSPGSHRSPPGPDVYGGMDVLDLFPSDDEFPSRLERRSRPRRSGCVPETPGRSPCGAAPGSSSSLGPTAPLPVPGRRFCRPPRSPPLGPSARDCSRARRLALAAPPPPLLGLPSLGSCGPASLPPPALRVALHLLAPPAPAVPRHRPISVAVRLDRCRPAAPPPSLGDPVFPIGSEGSTLPPLLRGLWGPARLPAPTSAQPFPLPDAGQRLVGSCLLPRLPPPRSPDSLPPCSSCPGFSSCPRRPSCPVRGVHRLHGLSTGSLSCLCLLWSGPASFGLRPCNFAFYDIPVPGRRLFLLSRAPGGAGRLSLPHPAAPLRFGGSRFYTHHVRFSSEAAGRLQQFNEATYWGSLDNEI